MSTLFIGDIHLSVEYPEITKNFFRFLQTEATQAESLYILGDLFDKWIGDDDPHPFYRKVAAELFALKKKGIPCYFIHGNRDFLIGQAFADESGMILLPECKVIQLYDYNICILHGDTLCTKDTEYQIFRKIAHHRFIQRLFLCLPLSFRFYIAKKLRLQSGEQNKKKGEEIMDVDPQSVLDLMACHDVDWIIHGHTHRPAIHNIEMIVTPLLSSKKIARRAVLSAWHNEGSMIKVTFDAIELIFFPFRVSDFEKI
ncbi:MAG: UDP-2,3-diacylglucosamine diphosphatase [Candidatus Hamiltonella defensa (Ceratovacuna japonica)]